MRLPDEIVCGLVYESLGLHPLASTTPALTDHIRTRGAEVFSPEFIPDFSWVKFMDTIVTERNAEPERDPIKNPPTCKTAGWRGRTYALDSHLLEQPPTLLIADGEILGFLQHLRSGVTLARPMLNVGGVHVLERIAAL